MCSHHCLAARDEASLEPTRFPGLRRDCKDVLPHRGLSPSRHGPARKSSRDWPAPRRIPDLRRAYKDAQPRARPSASRRSLVVHHPSWSRPGVSLVGGELAEARGLALVLRQAATTLLVEKTEIALPARVSLACGELVEACGFAIVLR